MHPALDMYEIDALDGSRAIQVMALFEESVLDVAHLTAHQDFTIGPEVGARFTVPSDLLPANSFPLVHMRVATPQLLFTPQMSGEVTIGDHSISRKELVQSGRVAPSTTVSGSYTWPIGDGSSARVCLGHNTFLVASVPAPRRHRAPLRFDWAAYSYTALLAVLSALFLIVISALPPEPASLSVDSFLLHGGLAHFLIKPPEEPAPLPEWLTRRSGEADPRLHRLDAGRMGDPRSVRATGLHGEKAPTAKLDPAVARRIAHERALQAGALGAMKAVEGSDVASIFGPNKALGNEADAVLAGLSGVQYIDAWGVDGGLGINGRNKGGGGDSQAIRLEQLPTLGKSGTGRPVKDYGPGGGNFTPRRSIGPGVVDGSAQIAGTLDKEIIRRIIRRHLNEVKFCYEKRLLQRPELGGRIVVRFTVAANGRVVAAGLESSGIWDLGLNECIAEAVRRWEFPPLQRGSTTVAYPFLLRAASAD